MHPTPWIMTMFIYSWPFGYFFRWFAQLWFSLGRGPITPPGNCNGRNRPKGPKFKIQTNKQTDCVYCSLCCFLLSWCQFCLFSAITVVNKDYPDFECLRIFPDHYPQTLLFYRSCVRMWVTNLYPSYRTIIATVKSFDMRARYPPTYYPLSPAFNIAERIQTFDFFGKIDWIVLETSRRRRGQNCFGIPSWLPQRRGFLEVA